MGVSGQRHAPAALYPRGKNPRYPLDRRLGGPQSRSGRRGQKKNLPLSGIEPRSPDCPARSQTLYCLSYCGSVVQLRLVLILGDVKMSQMTMLIICNSGFLDLVHRLYFNKITTFRKLDLLQSSGKKEGQKP
jgi:hypothetical protein